MNNVYFSSHRLTLGKEVSPSPDMSINSDGSVGTKKVLLYSSNSAKFFPKEKEESQELKINISEDMSFNTDHTPQNKNLQNSPSPKRSAIRNKGKSGTSYFFNPDNASELNDEGPQRTEAKKKTIKFGDKDEVKFFTMKEMSSKHEPTSRKNSLSRSRASVSSKNHSSNSRKYSSSIANTFKEDEEKMAGESSLFKNKKNGTADFGKSIAVIMIINHFLKQMKLKSGKFGRLGNKQFKILNDLGHDVDEGAKDDQFEFEPNLMARMIVLIIKIFLFLNNL